MALLALEGFYRNGKVELSEAQENMEGAKVTVIFPASIEADTEIARRKQYDQQLFEQMRDAARERLFARMEAGINFGGEKFDRNEIYEDRLNELEARRGR